MARPQARRSDSVPHRRHNRTETKRDALTVDFVAGIQVTHNRMGGPIHIPPMAWKLTPNGWEYVKLS